MMRNFAMRVLKENGYRPIAARTPTEAIRICKERKAPIELMLTDIVMPEMLQGSRFIQKPMTAELVVRFIRKELDAPAHSPV